MRLCLEGVGIMNQQQAHFRFFGLFVAIHSLLYFADIYYGLDGIVQLVSWLPWVPVSMITSHFTTTELLILIPIKYPNFYGSALCLVVWFFLYWIVSGFIASKFKGRFNGSASKL